MTTAMARRRNDALVLAGAAAERAVRRAKRREPLADSEIQAVRSFADGLFAARAEARAEQYGKLLKAEEKMALALWDAKNLDLPPGETIVVKRFSWDGENRHTMEVSVRVKGFQRRAGKPRGVGLAREHPGIATLFVFLAYRTQAGDVRLTERQAVAMTREVFPDTPREDRMGRLRRVKRQAVAASEGHDEGPLFQAIRPIFLEESAVKLIRALRRAETKLELDKPQRDEFRMAVDEIEKRSRPMLGKARE